MVTEKSGWSLGPAMDQLGVADEDGLLDDDRAVELLFRSAFRFAVPQAVGVELEWLVHDSVDTAAPVPPQRVADAILGVDLHGIRSMEPGGQLELSSAPADLDECVTRCLADMTVIRHRLKGAELTLSGMGMDPERKPRRYLSIPRYDAMESSFDRDNMAGRWMLCSTASVQVSLDAGEEDASSRHDFRSRWRAAHAAGPLLLAAFANSPLRQARLTGWQSTRQAMWFAIDRTRTAPPRLDMDPRLAWAGYVLDAHVVCIRREGGRPWTAPQGLTFREWVRSRHPRTPTVGDLRYHLSTLFPPVRPRGPLELRMIDAQPGDDWIVPLAVVKALLDDEKAVEATLSATESMWQNAHQQGDPWIRAARKGLTDQVIAPAAQECFLAARAALVRGRISDRVLAVVDAFMERYVMCGRSPADDLRDAFVRGTLPSAAGARRVSGPSEDE
ncbi:glutamate-cysteine ligase family protein [Streptomyces sp. NPDC051773]|uniref:glutamate-cysteine ligase family protein n=1 Tax=Streptomyces sp. NPDC051773 TaxID=3156682 RepID=UPI003436A099